MESPAPARGPCVYVPISHPDSPVPTYAVLQVLGVSPAPDPSLHPHFSPVSVPRLRPCPAPARAAAPPAHKRSASSAESTNSSSSSSDERDRHLTAIRPTPMKKIGGLASPGLSSPAARRNGKLLPFRGTISITHTDKDTIIHAAPSDFRKVVHELTGAASGSKGLKPISLPSRMMQANRAANDRDPVLPSSPVQAMAMPSLGRENGGSGEAMESAIVGKPADSPVPNLLERRKSSKVLARLLTSGKSSSPLVPSPDTPLSFDFEKIGLPTTPSSSEGRLTPGISMSPLFPTKALEALSLSGGHVNGCMPDLSRSYNVKDPSIEVRPCGPDAIAPDMSELSRSPGLSLRLVGEDVPLASPVRLMQDMQSSNKHVMRDADGLSLALAPAPCAARLANVADAPNAEEPRALEDAMDVETPCDDAGTDDPGTTLKESCLADDDESSVIAKKGFFFHSERPLHGDPTLLALFPESSKDS